jgi:hypothetical protein
MLFPGAKYTIEEKIAAIIRIKTKNHLVFDFLIKSKIKEINRTKSVIIIIASLEPIMQIDKIAINIYIFLFILISLF